MLSIENVNKKYKDQNVLHDVNLNIEKNEFVFLRGLSGSGKTTLLKILYKEINDYKGKIQLEGKPFERLPRHEVRRTISTIFQSFELLERKTALENVVLAGEVLGRKSKEIHEEAMKLLEQVGLKGKEHRFPNELSGGEQQRVAIARALLNKPKLLMADEPTGNLDPETATSIMSLLKEINEKNEITMLIVTHSDELVKQFPGRVVYIEKGVIREA